MFSLMLARARLRFIKSFNQGLLPLLLLAFAATSVSAQIGGIDPDPGDPGTGGRNTIQGNVYYPSGRRLDKRVQVVLQNFTGGNLHTMTDDNGAFSFRRLAGGSYTVVVDAGKEYKPATERVEIIEAAIRRGSTSGQTITVQIQLSFNDGVRNRPGVVDATLAGAPEPALKLYQEALDVARTGDHRKAVEKLNEALALYPKFMLALNELGVQYLELKQLDKAEDSLRKALKISPDAFIPRLNYGIVLNAGKKYADAAEELQRALERDDSSAVAHLQLGRALVSLKNYAKAEKELQRALKLGGDKMSLAHRFLGAAYIEQGKNKQAIEELETYLKLAPDASDAAQIRQIVKQLRG